MTSYQYPIYAGIDQSEWLAMHILAIISICASVCGSIFIIVFTLKFAQTSFAQSKTTRGKKVSIVKFIPLFFSIADLIFAITHISDHIASVSTNYVTEGVGCAILGYLTTISVNATAYYIMSMCIYLWVALVKFKQLDFGRFAWKLHSGMVIFCMVIGCIPFLYQGYGYISLCIVVCIVLYSWASYVLRKVNRHSKYDQGTSANKIAAGRTMSVNDRNKERAYKTNVRLANQMHIFIVIYVLQWLPYCIYYCVVFAGQNIHIVVTCLCVILTNLGGVFNGIAYLFIVKDRENKDNESTGNSYSTNKTSSRPESRNKTKSDSHNTTDHKNIVAIVVKSEEKLLTSKCLDGGVYEGDDFNEDLNFHIIEEES
eukprot:Pgem_evm1s3719